MQSQIGSVYKTRENIRPARARVFFQIRWKNNKTALLPDLAFTPVTKKWAGFFLLTSL
jgi:hypothetical protein